MILNESKTELMILHKTDKINESLTINNTVIKSKTQMKVLGVVFNQNLTWDGHVS